MRIWTLLAPTLALQGCTPGWADIRAEMREQDLVFTASRSTPMPFSRRAVDLRPDLVRVDHAGRLAWRIERKRDPRCLNYGSGGPSPVFPLTYGKVPPCFTEVVRAQPLTPGMVYRIAAIGISPREGAEGYFKTGITVESLSDRMGRPAGWSSLEGIYNAASAESAENAVQPTN